MVLPYCHILCTLYTTFRMKIMHKIILQKKNFCSPSHMTHTMTCLCDDNQNWQLQIWCQWKLLIKASVCVSYLAFYIGLSVICLKQSKICLQNMPFSNHFDMTSTYFTSWLGCIWNSSSFLSCIGWLLLFLLIFLEV